MNQLQMSLVNVGEQPSAFRKTIVPTWVQEEAECDDGISHRNMCSGACLTEGNWL
jgi:hypothetical protein